MCCVQHWLGKVCIEYDACSTGWEEDFTLNVVCAAQVGKSLH